MKDWNERMTKARRTWRSIGLAPGLAIAGHAGTPVAEAEFRPVDSGGNNIANPTWGAAGSNFAEPRTLGYADAVSSMPAGPNVRDVSNRLFTQSASVPDAELSEFVWVWGQFIAHDIDHTGNQDVTTGERIDITIPGNDTVFTPGQVIPVSRGVFDPATGTGPGNPRRVVNNLSAYIDATTVYGGDTARSDYLRQFTGGLMNTSTGPTGDVLPPRNGGDAGAPFMAGMAAPNMGDDTFLAGDVRGNEHVALTSMHTLFLREHNRLAALIDATHTDLPPIAQPIARDEEIYQRARKIVGAEIQAVTYNEFLPAMGIDLGTYTAYNALIDASISPEFATGAFRMGHTQTNNLQLRLEQDGSVIAQGHLPLGDMFFDPTRITDEGGIEPILRGLAVNPQEQFDPLIVEGLRSLLFGVLSPNGLVANGTDLSALDILRNRDFGVADYNTVREDFGLTAKTGLSDISSDPTIQQHLADLYPTVDDIDLFVGLLAEDLAPGEVLSETAEAIIAEQFLRLRDGDRFYFLNDADLALWDAPVSGGAPTNAAAWLGDLQLSQLILLNSSVTGIRQNVFLIPEPSAVALLAMGLLSAAPGRRRSR